MMTKMMRYCLPVLLVAAMLFAAVGCNMGGSEKNSVIQIKDILFEENQVTVIYEDGYEIKWDRTTLLKNALTYTSATFYTGSFSTPEAGTGSDADKVVTQASTATSSGTQTKTVTVKDAAELETSSDGKVIYDGIYTTTGGDGIGVRVMGTTGSNGNFSYVVVKPDGMSGDFSYNAVTSEGGDVQIGFNQMMTVTNVNAYMEIDGKKYATYDTDPRFAEYFSTRLTEATVLDAVKSGDGEIAVVRVLAGGFSDMVALEVVNLPSSIRVIEADAFAGCELLTDIFFDGTVEQWNAIRKSEGWDEGTGDYVVHCEDGDILKESGDGEDADDGDKDTDIDENAPIDKENNAETAA